MTRSRSPWPSSASDVEISLTLAAAFSVIVIMGSQGNIGRSRCRRQELSRILSRACSCAGPRANEGNRAVFTCNDECGVFRGGRVHRRDAEEIGAVRAAERGAEAPD